MLILAATVAIEMISNPAGSGVSGGTTQEYRPLVCTPVSKNLN
jgi:hypothetical protein